MTAYGSSLRLTLPARPADAADVHALTREAFRAYADLVPQPSSLRETVEDVARELRDTGGLVVREGGVSPGGVVPGRLLAAVRFAEHDGGFWLRRMAVHPEARREGLARDLVTAAEAVAAERGHTELRVGVRTPLADVAAFWRRRGFRDTSTRDYWVELARPLPLHLDVPTAQAMVEAGHQLAGVLRAGDLVVLTGGLGAGKTTLTRGLGAALGVRGAVTSPTFVIARVHPSTVGGPALVHADAYRLASFAEVDDLDLDASLDESVTVVEWGEGKVEDLATSRLEVVIQRPTPADLAATDVDDGRTVTIRGLGPRWSAADLDPLRATPAQQPAD